MSEDNLYADRVPQELEPYFGRHMMAMTAEGLHNKGAIAMELAWRDKIIDELRKANGEKKCGIPT